MSFLSRLFCMLALVAFAAGAVAHSAGSAAMATEMSRSDVSMTAMDDCDACGDPAVGIDGIICNAVCNTAGMAAIPAPLASPVPAVASDAHFSLLERPSRGIARRPSPQPPQSNL